MYTDEDLYSAVKAGVLKEESVNSFRKYMEASRNTKSEDEENFRLISGFNDIFVVVASLLFLISSAWLSNLVSIPLGFFGCRYIILVPFRKFCVEEKACIACSAISFSFCGRCFWFFY